MDGKVQTSDSVTVSDDGTIKITVADGSYVEIKGTAITYTNTEGKSSSGTLGTERVTLTGDVGEISATSTSETKTTGGVSEATATEQLPTRKTVLTKNTPAMSTHTLIIQATKQ